MINNMKSFPKETSEYPSSNNSRHEFKSNFIKEHFNKLQEEKDKASENYQQEKLKNQKLSAMVEKLKEQLDQEKEINRANQQKDQRISELERALANNTKHHQNQISKLNYEFDLKLESALDEKANQIGFLKSKLSQAVADLQTEIANRNEIIKEKVAKVSKQRDEDLKTFIESKEEIERKVTKEQELYKKRIQMDLEFKAFQNFHSSYVKKLQKEENEEEDQESCIEEMLKQKELELLDEVELYKKELEQQYEASQVQATQRIYEDVKSSCDKKNKIEKQKAIRDIKVKLEEEVSLN